MKNMFAAAMVLALAATSISQTTISDDWNSAPVGNDGRDGWTHNLRFVSDWTRNPQGDIGSNVTRFDDAGNGVLRGFERASGSEDRFVAPSKFTTGVNGGNFGALTSATLSYRVKTVIPTTPPTTANRLGVQVALFSPTGSTTIALTEANGLLPTGFYDNLNQWYTINIDLKNAALFTQAGPSIEDPIPSHDQVLAAVDGMLLDIDMISGTETHYIDDIVLTYDAGSGPVTVSSNFTDPGSITNDGRQGWTRNRADDGFMPSPQGDPATVVAWNTNALRLLEAGQGANDYFVAPSRYVVNGGHFGGLKDASFTFDYYRSWPETVAVNNRNGIVFRIYSGTAYAQFDVPVGNLPIDFFDISNIIHTITTPGFDSGSWTVSPATTPLAAILGNVTAILVDGEVVSGREINTIDNFSFTYSMKARLTGTIQFNNRVDKFPTGALVEYLDANGNVVDTNWAKITGTSFETYLPTTNGIYSARFITGAPFLNKMISGLSVTGSDISGQSVSMLNGDVNGDNEVGPADFTLLSAAFGSMLGDPPFNASADLNGDDEVGPSDFTILSGSFGELGD